MPCITRLLHWYGAPLFKLAWIHACRKALLHSYLWHVLQGRIGTVAFVYSRMPTVAISPWHFGQILLYSVANGACCASLNMGPCYAHGSYCELPNQIPQCMPLPCVASIQVTGARQAAGYRPIHAFAQSCAREMQRVKMCTGLPCDCEANVPGWLKVQTIDSSPCRSVRLWGD